MKYGLTTYRSYENKDHIIVLFVYGKAISKRLPPLIIQVEGGLAYSDGDWMSAPERDLAVFRVIDDKISAQREIIKEVLNL